MKIANIMQIHEVGEYSIMECSVKGESNHYRVFVNNFDTDIICQSLDEALIKAIEYKRGQQQNDN